MLGGSADDDQLDGGSASSSARHAPTDSAAFAQHDGGPLPTPSMMDSVLIVGDQPTFHQRPWHDSRGWWKVAANGEANDTRSHFGTCGDVAVAAVSIRGNRHRLRGEANQDSFAVSVATAPDGTEYVVVALCDGMGSVPYSAFGARTVAHTVCGLIGRLIREEPARWRSRLEESQVAFLRWLSDSVSRYRPLEFGAPTIPPEAFELDLAQTTLTFVVVPAVPESGSEGRTVLFGSVGDSPGFVLSNGRFMSVGAQNSSEGVWSTASEGVLGAQHVQFVEGGVSDDEALLVASDGVGNYLTYNGEATELGRLLAARWSEPVEWLEFIRDVSFQVQGADDDRTAIMLWLGAAGS